MIFNELILKVTSCCNLNCSYCYVFNQGDESYKNEPSVMNLEMIDNVVNRIKQHCETHKIPLFLVIFHGGEPLMAPKAFYEIFVDKIKDSIDSTEVLYGVQTNATLLTQEWIDLFDKLEISIGISLDGTKEASAERVFRSNGNCAYDDIIKGVELLRKNDMPLNILSVINTKITPVEIYTNLKKLDIDNADFLFPDVTFDTGGDSSTGAWLCDMFDLWYDDSDARKPMVRYFDTIVGLLLGIERGYEMLGRKVNKTISIKPNGNLELVDNLKVCGNGFTHTGLNIEMNSFDDIASNNFMKKYYRAHTNEVLCSKCKSCYIRNICGGGNIAHRYSKANQFDNPSAYCKDILTLVSHIQERLFQDVPEVFNSTNVLRLKELMFHD